MDIYDVFVTVPGNAVTALRSYGVPYSSIIAIAHGRYDIQFGLAEGNEFDEFYRPVAEQLNVIGYSGAIEKDNP